MGVFTAIGKGSMKEYTIKLLPLILLFGCTHLHDRYSVTIDGEVETIYRTEPNVEACVSIFNYDSHITFRCESWWTGSGPADSRAPSKLLTEVCVLGECDKNLMGPVSETQIWSTSFDTLDELEHVYCIVYIPEWYTFIGVPPYIEVDETFPERRVLIIETPVKVCKESVEDIYYCNRVVCDVTGCKCTSWY